MTARLDLVVGRNGAGKTTLITTHLQPLLRTPFVNGGEIAKQRWPDAPEVRAYDAAAVAAQTRAAR